MKRRLSKGRPDIIVIPKEHVWEQQLNIALTMEMPVSFYHHGDLNSVLATVIEMCDMMSSCGGGTHLATTHLVQSLYIGGSLRPTHRWAGFTSDNCNWVPGHTENKRVDYMYVLMETDHIGIKQAETHAIDFIRRYIDINCDPRALSFLNQKQGGAGFSKSYTDEPFFLYVCTSADCRTACERRAS